MKNSIAIWADKVLDESDLHINYWILKRRIFVRDHFLDFGVKLLNWSGGLVYFYFPCEITEDCISELGGELKDKELANVLFNENCEIITHAEKRFNIKLPSENLTVFEFDNENDVKFENKYGGTLISINVPTECQNWYLRFRIKIRLRAAAKKLIKNKRLQTVRALFSKKHTPHGSFYQTVRTSVEVVDFRINNRRNLNLSLLDENEAKFLRFRKLNFFLMIDNDEDIDFSSVKPKRVRLLENDVWNSYLHGVSGHDRKFCAHHWQCNPKKGEGWEIFYKVRYSSANFLTIALYLILACSIAIGVNISSSILYEKMKERYPCGKQEKIGINFAIPLNSQIFTIIT